MLRTRASLCWLFALPFLASVPSLAACGDDDEAAAQPGPAAGSAGSAGSAGAAAGSAGSAGAAAGSAGAAGSGGSDAGAALCKDVAAPCVGFPGGTTEQVISEAVVSALSGTTFVFGEGSFKFTNTLSVATEKVTIRGQGMDKTVLDFKGQLAGAEGLSVQEVPGFLIEDIHVRDTKGDGIKVTGSNGATFRRVRVEFTAEDATSRGAYGIYPVQCDNVLIEQCEAIGASDAGIYVGQSRTIIVRQNTARGNVAGIEIENCFNADVTENTATENVGGILVFDLPNLEQMGGHDVRVYKNQIKGNNTANFAPKGNIVASVPAGTGVFVMANRNVEIFDNDIVDNQTAALAVTSYAVALKEIADPNYYQWPKQVFVHDNRFVGNGKAADVKTAIGAVLSGEFPAPALIPELLIDGAKDPAATSDFPGNPLALCFKNNSGDGAGMMAAFVDLAFPDFGDKKSFDLAPYTCELPALAAVTLPAK
jgi:parallel beta-helix repeat protein